MAYRAKKTEHTGAKHGNGAYWGPKKEAKQESTKLRRRQWKQAFQRDPSSYLGAFNKREFCPSNVEILLTYEFH